MRFVYAVPLAGEWGQTVLRAGYSIAFVREGSDVMNAVIGSNPGGTLNANRAVSLNNLTPGTLFRNKPDLAPPTIPAAPTYPITPTSNPPYSPSDSANAFLPNLKIGYVQSSSANLTRTLFSKLAMSPIVVRTFGINTTSMRPT